MITNEQRQELRNFILENFDLLGLEEMSKDIPLYAMRKAKKAGSIVRNLVKKYKPDTYAKLVKPLVA